MLPPANRVRTREERRLSIPRLEDSSCDVRAPQPAHTTIARFSVRGPSRLAQKRMAVREGSVTRTAAAVKTYTTNSRPPGRSTRIVTCEFVTFSLCFPFWIEVTDLYRFWISLAILFW